MKKIIYILTLVLIAPVVFGQENYYGNTLSSNMYTASQVIGNPTIQPPDVASFQKVNFVPVSNYTGRANISVPIYEISAGSMNVPISISYNSSGVKVSDMASNIGLNWSLNAGGMISRMIKGTDDFLVPEPANSSIPYMTPSGWLGYLSPNVYTINHPNVPLNRYNDAEPDLFVVNAPGLSTKYVHSRHYTKESYPYSNVHLNGTDPKPIELEQQGNIIDETIGLVTKSYLNINNNAANMTRFGLSNVDITSTSGIVYSFSSPDISQYYSGIGGVSRIIYKIESSHLDQMFDPSTNQTITFEYEQYSNYFYDEMYAGVSSYGGGTDLDIIDAPHTVYPITQRLKKIEFDGGFVEFIYGLNRLDNTGDKALTEIKISNNYGVITKHIKFAYSYFQSSISSSTPQSKRLKLDRVYEVDANLIELPGHKFTYDTSLEMPPRDSYAHDFLGYNNGSYNASLTNPTPKYYFENNKVSPFYNSSAIELTGNYSLEANQNYTKTYSLTKITFPTGGTNEYEYELNEFNYSGTKTGGGLRIKTQKLVDENNNEQILDYEYSNGSIANMPTYAVFRLKQGTLGNPTTLSALTNYLGIDTFMTPRSQVEFTQGSFVGYGEVTVEDRIDNGYTKYYYKSLYPYSNLSPTITYPYEYNNWPDHSYSNSWSVICPNTLSVDRDFLRGKIISESIFNKNGKLRLQKSYNYTYKEFSNISLEYFNKSSSNGTCYNNDGSYSLSYYNSDECGGYVEKVDLPIVRDLLTTVTTSDYQSDELVVSQGGNENVPFTFKTTQTYSYDLQYPLLIKESKEVTICEETTQGGQECASVYQDYDHQVSKEITYPLKGGTTSQNNTVSTLPFANQLIANNRLSTPLRIEFKNKDSQIIAQEDHIYKDFGSNVLALEKINFVNRDGSITPSDIVTKTDVRGRAIEYQKKNGIYVSRIYGYDGILLIAEVIGSNWSNTNLKLHNLDTSYDQGTTANDVDIRALMSELRVELPETRITSYTYDALIGITSITDPSGYISYYVYDDFNRLQYIKDKNGEVLKSYKYHYQGQYDPDITPTYTVTNIIDGGLGSVSFNPSVVESGSYSDVTATPGSGYEIDYIKVGTTSYPFTNNTARINNITSDTEVHVKFKTLASPLTVSPTSIIFNFIDGNTTITVTASGSWTVSKSDSWITTSTTTGSGNSTFTVRPFKNLGLPRIGNVTVSNGSTTKLISIEQMGDEMF